MKTSIKPTDISEEHVAFIFRVEEKTEQDASVKACGKQSNGYMALYTTTAVRTSYLMSFLFVSIIPSERLFTPKFLNVHKLLNLHKTTLNFRRILDRTKMYSEKHFI
jgi:hypothetical protein